MARSQQTSRRSMRGYLILVAVVLIGGAILWSQGDLINPLESTQLLLNLSSGGNGFTMAGGPPSARRATSTQSSATTSASQPAAASASTSGSMTLETLKAELTAAGVNVATVEASMSAQGRSLDNLVSVVNSGRITVAELATRLKGETANSSVSAGGAQQPPAEGGFERGNGEGRSQGLLDIHWDAIGSVAYDLWFILAVSAVFIAIQSAVDRLISRFKRPQHAARA